MAKASVKIICKHCGKEFTHSKKCYSRKEADSYEAWAVSHIDMCPECRAKAQAERLMQGEVVEMHYSEYKNKYSNRPTIHNSYNPKTKTVLVVVKTPREIELEQRANASKSEIFTEAHSLAKAMRAENPEMTYRQCLSVCLKKVYASIQDAKVYLTML